MKKRLIKILSLITAVAITIPTIAYASSTKENKKDMPVGYSDIPIGTSNEITMKGTIVPTIMSVTMPSYIPFSIGNTIEGENKVISPRIEVKNNSSVPVEIRVQYTNVYLNNIPNVNWSNTADVGKNGIAIGFQQESVANQRPNKLSGANWLMANQWQNSKILTVDATKTEAMYVVGAIGSRVNANYSNFTVIPTLVVERAYN